jgi:hypothetical protein
MSGADAIAMGTAAVRQSYGELIPRLAGRSAGGASSGGNGGP